jgi:hypothetical protein
MVDVVQIPVYPEVPFLLYFIIGWILVIIVGLAAFIVLFLKRDMKDFSYRFGKFETDMGRVKRSLSHVGGWIRKFQEIEPKIVQIENFLATEVSKEMEVQLRERVEDMRQYLDTQLNNRTKDLSRFYLFALFEDISDAKDKDTISRKLDDLRLFVKFNSDKGYWDDEMQRTVSEFMTDMEKRWKMKDVEISGLFSLNMDKITKEVQKEKA